MSNWHRDFTILITRHKFPSKVERLKKVRIFISEMLLIVEDHLFAFIGQIHCFSQLLFDQSLCPAGFSWRWPHDGISRNDVDALYLSYYTNIKLKYYQALYFNEEETQLTCNQLLLRSIFVWPGYLCLSLKLKLSYTGLQV